MSKGENDIANVIARPPLIVLGTIVLAFTLDYFYPQGHMAQTASGLRYVASSIALLFALLVLGAAANQMRKAETNIPTWEPTLALATTGDYARSRNPIYLAFIIFLLGVAMLLSSDWLMLLIVPFVLIIHFGVIRREEAYLLARFGKQYSDYMSRVPRYIFGI
jgi:protein-S-isoprenylcysteine O-methyltransferase Ste14